MVPEPETVRAIVQARMSSSRLPGKVLAPLAGRPVLERVLDRVREALPAPEQVVLATSTDPTDEPVAAFAQTLDVPVVRGSLDDVAARFQQVLDEHPCDWFVRICADSPLMDPKIVRRVVRHHDRTDADLVTNRQVRTYPVGQSVEMVRTATFRDLDTDDLTPDQREHVTRVFYDDPDEFEIVNLRSEDPGWGDLDLAVDTLEDLRRLDEIVRSGRDPLAAADERSRGGEP